MVSTPTGVRLCTRTALIDLHNVSDSIDVCAPSKELQLMRVIPCQAADLLQVGRLAAKLRSALV